MLDALGHGYDVYTGIPDTDPGKKFAQELMRWRVLGQGRQTRLGGSRPEHTFMLERPELQRAMLAPFKAIAEVQAALGPSGGEWSGGYRNISKDITGVKLNELESMRLTLHGCHRSEIRGRAHVAAEGGDLIVKLWPQSTTSGSCSSSSDRCSPRTRRAMEGVRRRRDARGGLAAGGQRAPRGAKELGAVHPDWLRAKDASPQTRGPGCRSLRYDLRLTPCSAGDDQDETALRRDRRPR